MKKLLAGLFFSLLATSGFAADAIVEEAIVEVPAAYSWTGAYVGIQGGYSWFDVLQTVVPPANYPGDPDADGAVVGIQAGYRYQFDGGLVAGVEADIYGYSGADELELYDGTVNNAIFEANFGGSVRGQIGYALGRFLPYFTGGLAFVDYEGGTSAGGQTTIFPGTEFSDTAFGWTLGGGLAYAFTDNLVVNVDYRYSDFGSETFSTPSVGGDVTTVDLKEQAVKLGLSYKF